MFEENDYIIRQIKAMVKGLGKFMGLEEIKEFLNLSAYEESVVTDDELETIIAIAKLDLVMVNQSITISEVAIALNITDEEVKELLSYKKVATEEEIERLNDFIDEKQRDL